jgi:hypothetical protein
MRVAKWRNAGNLLRPASAATLMKPTVMTAPARKKHPEIRKLTLFQKATRSCRKALPLSVSRSRSVVPPWRRRATSGNDRMRDSIYARRAGGIQLQPPLPIRSSAPGRR